MPVSPSTLSPPVPVSLEPSAFAAATVAAETRAVNAGIVESLRAVPDRWVFPLAVIRKLRLEGKGTFPLAPESPRAHTLEIDGPHGPIPLRILAPEQPKGVYLHFHGGGWTLGSARENDGLNDLLVDRTGFAVVSVDYRLAPENPYPAGPDDCETAALWLMRHGLSRFGTERFAIGGESAGATLAVATLLRLRDRHDRASPFRAANLHAGCYDLGLTPSARQWGDEPLVLNTRDIRFFVGHYLRSGGDIAAPDVSPLYGSLAGLPPALLTVGTSDPLLDDTLFMASRWLSGGNTTHLAVYPGGCHVFISFSCALADQALDRIHRFLGDC